MTGCFSSIILSLLLSLITNGKSLNDSTKNTIIDRIVTIISIKCELNDSTKKELSKYFYSYYIELRKARLDAACERTCYNGTSERKKVFIKGLRLKFGNEVYQYYKSFIQVVLH
jgi:hypothetical protein